MPNTEKAMRHRIGQMHAVALSVGIPPGEDLKESKRQIEVTDLFPLTGGDAAEFYLYFIDSVTNRSQIEV